MRPVLVSLLLLAAPSTLLAQTPTPAPAPSPRPSPSPVATPVGGFSDEWGEPAPASTPWAEETPAPAAMATPATGNTLAVSGTTKSGAQERISDAAAQVTVLTGEEIAVFGHRTLADLIENAPESFVGGDRTYPILGVRGFARAGDKNTRILLLLDGHALNEPWNNYAPGGTDLPIDLTQVERVEILAGPVSALYGSNAFFGAVQIVTRRPTGPTMGGSLMGGSARYGRGAAWFGNGSNGSGTPWSLLVSGTGSWVEGDAIRHDDGYPTERDTDWDQNTGLTVKASRGPIAVLASGFARRKGVIAGAYGANFGDDRSFTEDSHALLDVAWSVVDRENVGVRLRAYGDAYRFEDTYRYDPDPVFRDVATSTWGGAEAVLTWTAGANRLVASIEESAGQVIMDAYQVAGDGTDEPDPNAPPNSVPIDRRSYNVVRGTIHDALRLGERVKLEAGAYAEAHDQYGLAAAPRAAIVVQAPWSTSIKALYGRGFRSPSIYEAYYDDSDTVIGNPDLHAETADVVELALEKSLSARSDAFLSGFSGQYRELMVLETVDIDPTAGEDLRGRFENGGTARSSGATAAFQTRRDRWVLWVDGTGFVHDEETQQATQGAPEWVAHAVAIVRAAERVTVGIRASGVGARPAREEGRRLDPYVVADLSVRVSLGGGFFARLSGTNLLAARAEQPSSEEYDPLQIPGAGPQGFFELRWER